MTVTLRWGGATDVGMVRTVNQDSMLLGPGVFVVADGMGGHQGGEVASALAVESISTRPTPPGVAELIHAVQDANETVFSRGNEDPSLAGMGTTFVGISLIAAGGEERLVIVNVGDSRAYRLSGGVLDQITDDHSLVAELVREGRITDEEAAVHPQRNIVTRALGIDETIPVDDFQILPHTGDRYLLCSDGLTNEVDDADIADVLRAVDDPDEAARDLVQLANRHGGRDNITVVIVDVVDDGGVSDRASALVPDDENFSESDDDTQTLLAVPDDRAHEQGGLLAPPGTESHDDERLEEQLEDLRKEDQPDEVVTTASPPRAITLRSVAFVLVVLGLIGGGIYLVNDYARNTYHVTLDDSGEVVVNRGRPGGVLWMDPSLVERTGIEEDDVPGDFLDDLVGGVSQPDLAAARRYVMNLEDRIEELTPPTTTTTTSTTSTTPTTRAPVTTAAN